MAYGEGRSGGFRRGGGFNRGGGGGFRRDFGPREMHKITCSECGKEGEVPFKPRQGTPVYCRECFAKRNGKTGAPHHSSEGSEESSEEM